MFKLIQLAQSWLWPASAEIQAEAQDTSSMADLVRLLQTDGEQSAPIDAPATDAGDTSAA
ncbi:hypothetical protein BH10PSE11_BH10PSE11_30840 [soil metagenome]